MQYNKIAFLGLGKMGAAMVERLLQAGFEVTVFNRTAAKMQPLIAKGAISSPSAGDAVKDAMVVMTCLLDDKSVLDITDEILPHLMPQAIHVGLSTIMPDTAKILLAKHQAVQTDYVSAVVLGVPSVALAGELTTFCAGNEAALNIVIPLLQSFSKNIVPLGQEVFAPCVMKICMNYSLATTIELISELYVFAESSGLDVDVVRKGLHQIYGHPGFKRYIDKIYEKNFDEVNFNMVGGNKDMAIFQEAFARVGVKPQIGNIVKSRFNSALACGMQDKDWSGIYEIVRGESELDK